MDQWLDLDCDFHWSRSERKRTGGVLSKTSMTTFLVTWDHVVESGCDIGRVEASKESEGYGLVHVYFNAQLSQH